MKATPFLMFQGEAKQAIALWQDAVPGFKVVSLEEHPEGDMAGKVLAARVNIAGTVWRLFDSPQVHDFDFTPATSIFIDCDDEKQLRAMADNLGKGGKTLMPLDDYGFSVLFTWITDQFGVSWQLNLP